MFEAERNELEGELAVLGHACGREAEISWRRVLVGVLQWARTDGRGDITLSVLRHVVSQKFRTRAVLDVGGEPSLIMHEGARNDLAGELANLSRACGHDVEIAWCRVLVKVLRWARTGGHGDIKLSVVDHVVGQEVGIDAVVTVGGGRK